MYDVRLTSNVELDEIILNNKDIKTYYFKLLCWTARWNNNKQRGGGRIELREERGRGRYWIMTGRGCERGGGGIGFQRGVMDCEDLGLRGARLARARNLPSRSCVSSSRVISYWSNLTKNPRNRIPMARACRRLASRQEMQSVSRHSQASQHKESSLLTVALAGAIDLVSSSHHCSRLCSRLVPSSHQHSHCISLSCLPCCCSCIPCETQASKVKQTNETRANGNDTSKDKQTKTNDKQINWP